MSSTILETQHLALLRIARENSTSSLSKDRSTGYTGNDLHCEDVQVHLLKSIGFYFVLNRFLDTFSGMTQ
ncbi:hypothetical protein [Leptospira interrogans]|uniref:hypothetical protein n=1 Tax=Leptospira interrogans TaxID=173 RepID=UPI0002BC2420|nr:hypothetical protein [Leptospira interrogans]AKH78341.1 hypothetical protein BRAT_15660 [Leptospira interrogans serovar Bratislava]KWV23444.1 hypothetical protein LA733_2614 [Leptospira interrogans]KWV25751.1 hypothetical protein LA702_2471 [Leptospira interrogans]UMQ58021.1 hypothetical protein FH585_17665 [Leptospira interrogans]UNE67914.1 hypothetical protein FH588_06570 [Leptospira interrogans]